MGRAFHARGNEQARAIGELHADFARQQAGGDLEKGIFNDRLEFPMTVHGMTGGIPQGTHDFGDRIHKSTVVWGKDGVQAI